MVKNAKTFDGLLSKMAAYDSKRRIFREYRKDPRNAVFFAITQAYPEACSWCSNLFYKYAESDYIHKERMWDYPDGLTPREWIDRFAGGKLIRISDWNIAYKSTKEISDLQIMDIFTQKSLSQDYAKTKTEAIRLLVAITSQKTGIPEKEIKEVVVPNAKLIIAISEED